MREISGTNDLSEWLQTKPSEPACMIAARVAPVFFHVFGRPAVGLGRYPRQDNRQRTRTIQIMNLSGDYPALEAGQSRVGNDDLDSRCQERYRVRRTSARLSGVQQQYCRCCPDRAPFSDQVPAMSGHQNTVGIGMKQSKSLLRHGVGICLAVAFLFPTAAAARCIPVALAPTTEGARVHLVQADKEGMHRNPKQGGKLDGGLRGPVLPAGHVGIVFLGHSSFLIRTHENATAITDYNGYLRAPFAPDIVTMNRAHSTHYTENVEPGVRHVLRGWPRNGKIPRHDVRVRDLRVTNVPTNIRDDGSGIPGRAGNSIFVFESAGLCVVHLGHLHHALRPGHAGRVGSVDILLAPIDNTWTMSHNELVKVIDRLRPVVVIPMHYGYGGNLERFIVLMKARKYKIKLAKSDSAHFMKATLPVPTVVVLTARGS